LGRGSLFEADEALRRLLGVLVHLCEFRLVLVVLYIVPVIDRVILL
jgi:phage shock protein PspC (stress-responsive transcriptional regulator)